MPNSILLVGLGNPGPKYAANRHNFGFMVVDELASRGPVAPWREKFQGSMARAIVDDVDYTFLKPMTFMNLSGECVARAAAYFGFDIQRTIVVHDELDLEFGAVRVKDGGGTAGHKGLASIKSLLGDDSFIRVRMGIGRPERGSVTDYVLRDFNQDERAVLQDVVKRGADAAHMVAVSGVARAMNEFNRRG